MLNAHEILQQPAIRAQVDAHAMAWFPRECCGLLVEGPDGAEAVLLENLADKYHALDPETYPRQAEIAYILNPLKIMAQEEAGRRVVAIFHSHCGYGSYFSQEDIEQALAPRFEPDEPAQPRYPGVEYVVLNAHAEGVRGYRSFRFDDASGAFVESSRHGDIRGSKEQG
ncbi:MAG: Mov34/MPN/PAD-1 family protein [Deltaproteobacteria bacterium]|nr:Mov34/MPN/PAD-1 family protein [Deltaproteobacteria bacterium]MCB9786747.1 Mov34/MPN/PAD-1 family protein [Deltaproteobacteria bacterium]